MNKPLEKNLQGKIMRDLRNYGKYVEAYKNMKTSDNGIPDIFFTSALTGAVLVELKRKDEEARRLQKFKIKKLNECGTPAFVCDSLEGWLLIKDRFNMNLMTLKEAHKKRNPNS